MLIALAFAHFSSELLLKEQMIITVKKTLNNAGHIDAKLIDFSEICQKKSSRIGCFYWLFLSEVPPPKFPVESADFSKNFPLKILRNLTFPLKSGEISRFFCEFWLFSGENPAKFDFFPLKSGEIDRFFCEFDFSPAKIPRNQPIFPRIWVAIYVLIWYYDQLVHFDKEINANVYHRSLSGSILNVSTVHLNGIWHYLSKPVLGGHPVLSREYSIPRGCPFHTGFIVSSKKFTFAESKRFPSKHNPPVRGNNS